MPISLQTFRKSAAVSKGRRQVSNALGSMILGILAFLLGENRSALDLAHFSGEPKALNCTFINGGAAILEMPRMTTSIFEYFPSCYKHLLR
jgi:hypothetical protein